MSGICFFTFIAFSGAYLEKWQNEQAQREWNKRTEKTKEGSDGVDTNTAGSNYTVTSTTEDQVEMTNKV